MKKISFLFLFISNLFAVDKYTISVCTSDSYEEAVYCKNNILKDYKDVSIVSLNNSLYRTNYGIFETYEEANRNIKFFNSNIQKQKPFILKISKNDEIMTFEKELKTIYLTFDDGPVKATDNILKVISEENVPVTMFFVGKHIENNRNIYNNSLLCPNVYLGNHSYSHANGKYRNFYRNTDSVVADIKKINQIIFEDKKSQTESMYLPVRLAGRNVFRLPSIIKDDPAIDTLQREKERLGYDGVSKEGFYIYGWDVEWTYDSSGKPLQSSKDMVNLIEKINSKKTSHSPNKIILLMHDYMFSNHLNGRENLQSLIRALKERGWKFAHIEEYISNK